MSTETPTTENNENAPQNSPQNAAPALEAAIREKLTGEAQKNALNFVAHALTSGLTLDARYASNSAYLFNYFEESVFLLGITPFWNVAAWNVYLGIEDHVVSNGDYDGFPVDEALREFARANAKTCEVALGGSCGCGKQPGRCVSVFGKKIENNCASHVLWFVEPGAETLENIYKLAEVWKSCLADAKGKKGDAKACR